MRNKKGYVLLYVIMVATSIAGLAFIMANLIDINSSQVRFDKQNKQFEQYSTLKMQSILKLIQNTNSGGLADDILYCSGGIINCYEGSQPTCSGGLFMTGSDGIADSGDNDDYRGSYYSGSVTGLLSAGSKISDDDDLARRISFGFISPKTSDTVFAENDKIKGVIDENRNNTGTYVMKLSEVADMDLNGYFSFTGGSIKVHKIDKSVFNSEGRVKVLDTLSGTILSNTGYITTTGDFKDVGARYAFDFNNFDYAINVYNPGTSILQYQMSGTSSGKQIYIYPIDDSVTPAKVQIPYYEISSGKSFFRSYESSLGLLNKKYKQCVSPWLTILSNSATLTAFSSPTVPYGNTCVSETRLCNDGILSGTFANQSCSVLPPANCTDVWLGTISHGSGITAYSAPSVPYGSTCSSELRTCSNGTLSGSYIETSCVVSEPKSCRDIKVVNPSATDGNYTINPTGTASFTAYCDMTTDGGGWTRVFYSNSDSVLRTSISGSDWNAGPAINFSRLWSMRDIKNGAGLYEFYVKDSSDIGRHAIFTQTNRYDENPVGNSFNQKSGNFYYSTQTNGTAWKGLGLGNFGNANFNARCTLAMSSEGGSWTYCLQDQFEGYYGTGPWFYDLVAYPSTGYDLGAQQWVVVYQR